MSSRRQASRAPSCYESAVHPLLTPASSLSGVSVREIIGMVVVGVIILAVWLAFLNLQKIVEKGDDGPPPDSKA